MTPLQAAALVKKEGSHALAETIVVALCVAVAFALVLIPVLSSLLLKSGGSDENEMPRDGVI